MVSLSRIAPILLLALCACSPARGLEAWRLLDDLSAGWGPSALKVSAPAPTRSPIAYEVAGRTYDGDLYRPADMPKAALVLVPGAAPDGKDDPRLVALATSLARVRFVVLVPEIPNLRDLKVRPEDAEAIADALRHLAERPETPGGTLGLVAISFAAGPAVLAALEPEVRARLRFLVAVGGYYDIEALVTFSTTGRYRAGPGRAWCSTTPNPAGKWVFLRGNAERVGDPRDRVLLSTMARRKLDNLEAPIDDLIERLGPEGQAVHALLVNSDPDAVPGLIARLPEGVRSDMRGLDLRRRDLSPLRAEVILIHGRDDAVIPFTESQALAAALGPERARLTLVDNLAHVELGPADVFDSLRLWGVAYRVLTLRDLNTPAH